MLTTADARVYCWRERGKGGEGEGRPFIQVPNEFFAYLESKQNVINGAIQGAIEHLKSKS